MHDVSATNPPPTPAAPVKPKIEYSEGGINETIVTILLAFMLAFICRGFVVEAFVIPTGSMDPTLLCAHMRFTCDDCGYTFDTNYSVNSKTDDMDVPSRGGK